MKNEKKLFFLVILFLIFTLNGCAIKTAGNTLHGFTMRMNGKNENYSMTTSGYIYDKNNKTLTKYFVSEKTNIMILFNTDENNELCALNIVFDNLDESNTQQVEFIKNCIECYCNNTEISEHLLNEINFPQVLYKKEINTLKSKIGNTEMLIDVTDIGCVISVVQNIQ